MSLDMEMTGEFTSKIIQCRPSGCRQAEKKETIRSERGTTLIETLMACAILLVVVVGILPMFVMGFKTTDQQGNVATRTSEYAQDKMESLLSLNFTDGATDTTVYPPAVSGGTGLGGSMAASATVGAIPPTAAATGYVDYLDASGNLLTSSTGAYYTRQWTIATDSTATLKTITVVASLTATHSGSTPTTTLVSVKSNGL
jgi:hypothetical protein